jgi:hypothetical protein
MVPRSLRTWFVVHFWADVLVAVPLFLAPHWTLSLLGWQAVDPLATRLVAAALFGIGIQSLVGRNEDVATFRALLNLKIIWSAAATLGLVWSELEGGPSLGWAFAAVFAAFNVLWVRYRLLLRAQRDAAVA